MLKKSIIALACSLFLLSQTGIAQNAAVQRSDAAVRTAQGVDRSQAAGAATSAGAGTSSAQVEADLGEQQDLTTGASSLGVYGLGETGLFYTSNAQLTPDASGGDMYFFARAIGGLRPDLGNGLFLDGYVSQEVFEYARFSALDFL